VARLRVDRNHTAQHAQVAAPDPNQQLRQRVSALAEERRR
jgi:hypothetical protein